MKFETPLRPAILLRRYKRFLADVRFTDLEREEATVHCPNPGAMTGLMDPQSEILVSDSSNPKRKLRYTWELIRVGSTWVGIHTGRANSVVAGALEEERIPELSGYFEVRREVPYGRGSRVDFVLGSGQKSCYLEVKSVTLAEGPVALFPDSVTERGRRHLEELITVVEGGARGVLLFVVNREDCSRFEPAARIDPRYAETLTRASRAGVEILAYSARLTPMRIDLESSLPVCGV